MNKKPIKISLAAKNALAYFVIFIITIGLIGYFLLANSSREILKASETQLSHTSELASLEFSKFLDDLSYDIRHISGSPFLYRFLENPNAENYELLANEYQSLLRSKPHYFQIRYIGRQNDGKEVIRVERNNNQILSVDTEDLQLKGNREYFYETIDLPPDSIYISEIDLNKEYGQISTPLTPTLRMAYPVYVDSTSTGIVVINTDLSLLFESISRLAAEYADISVVNSEAYYIFHKDSDKSFEFEYDRPSSFMLEYGKTPLQLIDNDDALIRNRDEFISMSEIRFPRNEYRVYILASANTQQVLAGYFDWRNKSFLIIAILALSSLLVGVWLMRRQVRELRSITEEIQEFPSRLKDVDISTSRNDEIGVLAQSFKEMAALTIKQIQQLKKARQTAEEAVREKQEFIENMSHEIRNPIQGITGLTRILQDNQHLPHQEQLLESLRLNTSMLENLVNDVLDYKKIQRNEIHLDQNWVSIPAFLEELIRTYRYQASLKKLNIKLEMHELAKNHEFKLDKIRLGQVISNLLSNAIKFTGESGMITLTLDCKIDNSDSADLHFKIKDSGIGISQADLQRIKERYYRASQENVLDGSGLGLNIVSRLLNLHGSELEIYSDKNQGSEFSFHLNTKTRKPIKHSEMNTPGFGVDTSDLKLLILEDDKSICDLYRHCFNNWFQEMDFIGNDNLPDEKSLSSYDILIADYRLGDLSLDKLILDFPALANIPVKLIVSAVSPLSLDNLGVQFRFLQKPVPASVLQQTLKLEIAARKYGLPDLSGILEDYDGNLDKFKNALKIMTDDWTLHLKNLNAEEPIDKESIRELAHKLITSARRLKLQAFEKLLSDLEIMPHPGEEHIAALKNYLSFYLSCLQTEI